MNLFSKLEILPRPLVFEQSMFLFPIDSLKLIPHTYIYICFAPKPISEKKLFFFGILLNTAFPLPGAVGQLFTCGTQL